MLKQSGLIKKTINFLNKPIFQSSTGGGVSDLRNPAPWMFNAMIGSLISNSGAQVSGMSAYELTPYYAAIRNISEDIAKLPVNIHRELSDGQKLLINDNERVIYNLLNKRSNKYVSAFNMWETLVQFAIGWGNGYAEIAKDTTGMVRELHIIHPSRVKLRFQNEELLYDVSTNVEIQGQKVENVTLRSEDVLHLHGLGSDGIIGYALWFIAQESLGLSISQQEYAASYYSNGTSLTGTIEAPGKLDKEAYKNMRASWRTLHQGNAKNSHDVAILEQGTKFNPIAGSAQETQLIEARKFQVLEVSRLTRMPPHKMSSMDAATYSNIDAQNKEYHQDTLIPWIKRASQEVSYKFYGEDTDKVIMHEVNELTLGDSKTRMEVAKGYRNMGVTNINETRKLLNMNKIDQPGADDYHMQSNVTTIDKISEGSNLKTEARQSRMDDNGRPSAVSNDFAVKTEEKEPMKEDQDMLKVFEEAKEANGPIFQYASKKVIDRENKALKTNLFKKRRDEKGFLGWAENFFERQKAEIVEVFTPCCQVFKNTYKSDKIDLDMKFLHEFAENYSNYGLERSKQLFSTFSGEYDDIDSIKDVEKMANTVMNLMASKSKGTE